MLGKCSWAFLILGQLIVLKLLNNSSFTSLSQFITYSKKKNPCNHGYFCIVLYRSNHFCLPLCQYHASVVTAAFSTGHFATASPRPLLVPLILFFPQNVLAVLMSLPEEFQNQLVKFQNLPIGILMEMALNWHHYNIKSSHQKHVNFSFIWVIFNVLKVLWFPSYISQKVPGIYFFPPVSANGIFSPPHFSLFFFFKGFVLVKVLMVAIYRDIL